MILIAVARFAVWEAALFAAACALAWAFGFRDQHSRVERWLAILSIQVTLESSIAGALSFARANSAAAYWIFAGVCAVAGMVARKGIPIRSKTDPAVSRSMVAVCAALAVPLLLLSFKPVEEIDSINYLHYLIDWMGNRATPYTFATNYVASWELSFLPAWTVTGVDFFFPLLALKSVILLGLAAWLVGRELEMPVVPLFWTVAGTLALRHLWYEHSGVPTLKNDALHGVGFLLLGLVLLRVVRGGTTDWGLLAIGSAFAAVKYTGIFLIPVALLVCLARNRRRGWWRGLALATIFFVCTSGHYYLHTLLEHGSPFYPFQINLAFIHLPGTADLSATSILYSLRDPRLWQILFLPEGGLSPAGLLFPVVLAVTLLAASWRCLKAAAIWLRSRVALAALDWAAFWILVGWILYFRSVFSASASVGGGDLTFLANSLNSIRYVDGVLAASEIFLVLLVSRWHVAAMFLVGLNLASRLFILYSKFPLDLFPLMLVIAFCGFAVLVFLMTPRRVAAVTVMAILTIGCPLAVERNRIRWTDYWNDLKPALNHVRPSGLVVLALEDGGYFAGHVVAAGNPVDSRVESFLPEDLDRAKPTHLALLVTPGSEAGGSWKSRYASRVAAWGYRFETEGKFGAILTKDFR